MPINWGNGGGSGSPIAWDDTTWRDVRLSVGGPDTANLRAALRASGPSTLPPRTWQDDWAASPFFAILGAPIQWAADAPGDLAYAAGHLGGDATPDGDWWATVAPWLAVGAVVFLAAQVRRAR